MANLLPQEYLTIVKKERHVRAAAAFCVVLVSSAALGSIFLTPSLLLLRSQIRDRERSMHIVQGLIESQDGDTVLSEVNRTKLQIERLEREFSDIVISDTLIALQESTPAGVRLQNVNYRRDKGGVDKLTVSGVAATRDALLAFTRLLEREPLFTNVVLPVSDLAENIDIGFSITFDVPGLSESGASDETTL